MKKHLPNLAKTLQNYHVFDKYFLSRDLNCRTGNQSDFIEDDSYLPKTDMVTLPDNYSIDLIFKRKSRDKTVNSQGKRLLEMCIESRLRILNGRSLGDSVGNLTYFDALGGCRVVDYMIVSEDIIPDTNLQNYCEQKTLEETVSDLAMFVSEIDTCNDSQVDINHFNNLLSNILINAASNSVKFKIHHRKRK